VERSTCEDQISRVFERLCRFVNQRDATVSPQIWEKDAVIFQPNGPPIRGVANILSAISASKRHWQHDMRVACDEIEMNGNLAFSCGTLTVRMTAQNSVEVHYLDGKFLAILKQAPSLNWLFYRVSYNSSVPLPVDTTL